MGGLACRFAALAPWLAFAAAGRVKADCLPLRCARSVVGRASKVETFSL